jgi:aurora kinase, other
VALKQIKKETVRSILPQFISEIKMQLSVNHPNAVKLYGHFHDSSHIYLILEYLEEGSLYGLIKKKGKLN